MIGRNKDGIPRNQWMRHFCASLRPLTRATVGCACCTVGTGSCFAKARIKSLFDEEAIFHPLLLLLPLIRLRSVCDRVHFSPSSPLFSTAAPRPIQSYHPTLLFKSTKSPCSARLSFLPPSPSALPSRSPHTPRSTLLSALPPVPLSAMTSSARLV
jgi:hypothetical protein